MATERLEAELEEHGFTDRDDYEAAKQTAEAIEKLESSVREYRESVRSAKDRLGRAEEAAKGVASPDMKLLEIKAERLGAHIEFLVKRHEYLSGRRKNTAKTIGQVQDIDNRLNEVFEEYAVYGDIAKAAKGDNAAGLTLQRFVLTTLLDDVLDVATKRLYSMSRRRYRLQRVLDRIDRRKQSGLDLEVFDEYTGTSRPVSSLSGGESFLAALSLALALADIVQRRSGRIRLDTVFIDEGFGSLDPESLDCAVNALIDLQATGRLVGVISHVPELKERIDVRLEVVATRNGSSAKFVLP